MIAKNVLGIVYSNSYDSNLNALTARRTMGSVPFAGRYRLIDFALSNMVNSNINNISVITITIITRFNIHFIRCKTNCVH